MNDARIAKIESICDYAYKSFIEIRNDWKINNRSEVARRIDNAFNVLGRILYFHKKALRDGSWDILSILPPESEIEERLSTLAGINKALDNGKWTAFVNGKIETMEGTIGEAAKKFLEAAEWEGSGYKRKVVWIIEGTPTACFNPGHDPESEYNENRLPSYRVYIASQTQDSGDFEEVRPDNALYVTMEDFKRWEAEAKNA